MELLSLIIPLLLVWFGASLIVISYLCKRITKLNNKLIEKTEEMSTIVYTDVD